MDITISQTAQHIQEKAIWMHQNVFKTWLNGSEKVKTMFLILMLLSAETCQPRKKSTHDDEVKIIQILDHSSTCELSLTLHVIQAYNIQDVIVTTQHEP